MRSCFLTCVAAILLVACVSTNPMLVFKSDFQYIEIEKSNVIAAEVGEDVLGKSRVIITVSPNGLNIINEFLKKNMNKNMDVLYGDQLLFEAIPIRTDHFLKDIIIPFKDNEMAKKFYNEIGPKH